MATVTGFRTPEEAALELELPLLATLETLADVDGPVAAAAAAEDGPRRNVAPLVHQLLRSPLAREGPIGLLGDVPASRRARMAASIAAALAAQRTTVLVDSDLRHAHLSFDDRRRAQEGLVDVLRYGVRSPRVVAPTLTPGLALLPVGSRTVDLAGTFGAEAVPALFAELRRGGELVFVNGPDVRDVESATPMLKEVAGWVLVHEMGTSDPARTRAIRDRVGRSACFGVLVTGAAPAERPPAPAATAATPLPPAVRATMRPPGTTAPPSPAAESPRAPEPSTPPSPPRPVSTPTPAAVAPPPSAPRRAGPTPPSAASEPAGGKVAPAAGGKVAPADGKAEPARAAPGMPVRRRRPPAVVFGGVAVILLSALAFLVFGRGGGGGAPTPAPPLDEAPPPRAAVPQEPATGAIETIPSPSIATDAERLAEGATGEAPGAESPVEPAATTPAPAGTVSEPVEGPTPEPEAVAPAPLGPVVWGVHLSSVKSREGAQNEAATLAASGEPTFIRRTEIPDKGTWWRIYTGPYGTREEADRAAARLHAQGKDYAQVHKLRREEVEAGRGREDR